MSPPPPPRRAARLAPLVCACACGVAACAGAPYTGSWGQLPPPSAPVVLPIRDPLRRPDLAVEAVVAGPTGASARVWMLVDSGATGVSVPEGVQVDLGLRAVGHADVTTLGARRVSETIFVAPRFSLGDLTAADVPITASRHGGAVLGQSILRHAPWEVAWDRGTLTLGAAPWDERPEVSVVALHATRYLTDEIDVRIEGRLVRMLLDTGALVSALPADLGAALGLPARPFHGAGMKGAGGPVPVSRAFVGTLEIGALTFVGHAFAALEAGGPAVLGRDILSRFDFQVVPGSRLMLRRRDDMRGQAAERLARWPWLPPVCRTGACVRGRIERAGVHGRIEIASTIDVPFPVDLVLGCAAPRPAASAWAPEIMPTSAELLSAGRVGAPFSHLLVSVAALRAGGVAAGDVPLAGRLWFAPDGTGCRELAVLDVGPGRPEEAPPPGEARGAIWP
jgi:predicted aspartyl protease